MTRTAVIMAGGRGERMARSGVADPKPLVAVQGRSLLEWNLRQLIAAGTDRVLVSVAAADRQVRDVVATSLVAIGAASSVDVDELVEDRPLGNIGALGLLAPVADPVLVVYADNLTGLDLGALVDDHASSDADLTLAAHHEPFPMPFGELATDPEDPARLVRYVEKPTYRPLVASGVVVLGPRAIERAAICAGIGTPIGISELAQALVDEGAQVRLWRHDAPWVDVNDGAAIARAEAIIAEQPGAFARAHLAEEVVRP